MIAHEIITTPNTWRAQKLAEFIVDDKVYVRRTWTTNGGHTETLSYIHPEFQGVLYHERAYLRDVRATLEALALRLQDDPALRTVAERQGITPEGIEEMIECDQNGT